MHQLKYLDEIRPMDEIGDLGNLQQVDSKELSLGKTLVENLTTERFDLGQYSDSYAKELQKLIEAKSKGQKVTIKEQEEEPTEKKPGELIFPIIGYTAQTKGLGIEIALIVQL